MDIEARLREILHGIDEEIDVSALTRESSLKDDAGLGSVALLYMAVALEDEYGIDFSNENLGELKTIGDVIDIIEKNAKK